MTQSNNSVATDTQNKSSSAAVSTENNSDRFKIDRTIRRDFNNYGYRNKMVGELYLKLLTSGVDESVAVEIVDAYVDATARVKKEIFKLKHYVNPNDLGTVYAAKSILAAANSEAKQSAARAKRVIAAAISNNAGKRLLGDPKKLELKNRAGKRTLVLWVCRANRAIHRNEVEACWGVFRDRACRDSICYGNIEWDEERLLAFTVKCLRDTYTIISSDKHEQTSREVAETIFGRSVSVRDLHAGRIR